MGGFRADCSPGFDGCVIIGGNRVRFPVVAGVV